MFTNRFFTVLVILALAAIIVLTVREAMATSAVASNAEEAHNLQRGRAADAARWTDLAEYYQSHPELGGGLTRTVETASEVAPIDECFDVSLSEVAACREASQAPAP